MNTLELKPIGMVHSSDNDTREISLQGTCAVIEVFPEYAAALERIEEHSHMWILSWFHEARRDVLVRSPAKINPDAPSYGVFALRSPVRPNPIALTLVELDCVRGNRLHVSGLDAVNGTPVLDIKPYYEQDIVFSPQTARIVAATREMRKNIMDKEAIRHHREACPDLWIAVRMALIAEERLGKLNDDEIMVEVTGSICLGDVLQGLTRARLACPPRFVFRQSVDVMKSTWIKRDKRIFIELRENADLAHIEAISDEKLFKIETN
jgi:tRNA (adenine37-N6)-methyltransferase